MPARRGAGYPLQIRFRNSGNRALQRIDFHVEAHRPGRSRTVLSQKISSDFIVPPNGDLTRCWSFDRASDIALESNGDGPASLNWSVASIDYVYFE